MGSCERSQVEGCPSRVLNCIGPAQQPWRLTPERTPGARERPWSASIEPIAASTVQGTPERRAASRYRLR
jgi:hypothetical protein